MERDGEARKPGKKLYIGAAVAALLLIVGCGLGGKDDDAAEKVPAADTAKILTEVDGSLKAPVAAMAKGDKAAFPPAADALRAGADKLKGDQVSELAVALRDLADETTDAGTAKLPCPAGSPAATVLKSDAAERVRSQAKTLAAADASFKFGTFLPGPPKEENRRLANGTMIRKGPNSGSGELVIENGSDDTTVSAVAAGSKKPAFVVYVRGGSKHTVKNIKTGTYDIFTAGGKDWDAGKKGFTRDCGFTKFDDNFKFDSAGTRWTITLEAAVGGNASTSDVDPGTFPTT